MKNKLKKPLFSLLVLIFWLAVWETAALIIDLQFVLPTIEATASALVQSVFADGFLISVFSSIFRVLIGFVLGVIISSTLAVLAVRFPVVKALFSPVMTVAKSTPVAAIIIILWLMIGGSNVPVAVSILMVMPIIWQNLLDGYSAIDQDLEEVCLVYGFGFFKRFRLLVLPTLMKFLFPGLITASGLAWKAGIAAEIICMTKDSIGKEIYNAKYMLDGPKMFAWTILVIALSCLIEWIIKQLVERISRRCHL